MIFFSRCDSCKHMKIKDGWLAVCKAFPDGISKEAYRAKKTAPCANGYTYEEINNENAKFIT